MLDSRLHYTVAVARAGSFTAAARIAGVTQSAVTRSVADLEREIGYAIFYRTARGAILTERGRDFIDGAARLLEDAHDLLRGSSRQGDPYSGMLRIGVAPASLEWLLVDPLAELLRRYPGIRYDIRSAPFETVVQQLRSGSVDVAIGFDAAFGEWSDLRREPMGALETVLFVRRGHPLLSKEKITLDDVAGYDFVSPSESRPYGEVVRDLYERRGLDWHLRVHRIDYFPLARRIVARSDAIAVAGLAYTQSDQFKRNFAALRDFNPFPSLPMCCAVRARWEPKPAVRAFMGAVTRGIAHGWE